MPKYFRSRRFLLIALAVLVTVCLLAVTAIFVTAQTPNAAVPDQAKKALKTSATVETLSALTPKYNAISINSVPATEAWWRFETTMAPTWQLKEAWNRLAAKPATLGGVVFASPDHMSNAYFDMPTIFLGYKSENTAALITRQLAEGNLKNSAYQVYTAGNVVIIIPTFIYSDQLFKNARSYAKTVTITDASTSNGYQEINWKNLNTYFSQLSTAKNYALYTTALKNLGYDSAAKNPRWYGTSTDTVHWLGKNVADNGSPVWRQGDPDAFIATLTATSGSLVAPTSTVPSPVPTKADDPNYNPPADIELPAQSLMLSYFTAATDKKVWGSIVTPGTGKITKPVKITKPNTMRYVLNPNAWIGIMTNPSREGFDGLLGYSRMTIDVANNGDMNIAFSYPVSY